MAEIYRSYRLVRGVLDFARMMLIESFLRIVNSAT